MLFSARQLEHLGQKKHRCSQSQFCFEFSPKWGIFSPKFCVLGKNFLTQINLYNRSKLAYENLILSIDCTACIFVLYLNTKLPTLVFLYNWSILNLAYFFITARGLVLVYNYLFSRPRIMRVVEYHFPSSPMRRMK